MKLFFLLLLTVGIYFSTQAQPWSNEWRGYMASSGGNFRTNLFIVGETLWMTDYDLGVQQYDMTTGRQHLSTTYRITHIKEDRNGKTWGVGVNNTLYTYQQNTWQPFTVPDSVLNKYPPGAPGFDMHQFVSVDFDQNNVMWLAALQCIWRYDGQTWTHYDRGALNAAFIQFVSVDQNNIVWFNNSSLLAYTQLSILSYDGTTWSNYGANDFGITLDYTVDKAHIDADNKKWWNLNCANTSTVPCVDSNLFLTYNDTIWEVVTQGDLNTTHVIARSIRGDGNKFWTSFAYPQAMAYYDEGSWTFYDAATYGIVDLSRAIAVDSSNNCWGRTYLDGFSFDGTTVDRFKVGMNSSRVTQSDLERSAGGNMWVSNGEVGTINFNSSTVEVEEPFKFSLEPNITGGFRITNRYYTKIKEIAPNDFWVLRAGSPFPFSSAGFADTLSLLHYNGNTWTETKIDTQVAPRTTNARDMAVQNNNVWLSTQREGLLKWDGQTWTGNYPAPLDTNLKNIVATPTGTLWISKANQLLAYDGNTVVIYDHTTTNIPDADITALEYDQTTNTLWATTDSAGLLKYNNNTWTTYSTQNSGIATDLLFCIALSTTGEVWMGSRDSGLVHYDGVAWKTVNFNTPNTPFTDPSWNFRDRRIYTVEVDSSDNVWFFIDENLWVYQEGGLINVRELPNALNASNSRSYPNPFTHSTVIEYTLTQPVPTTTTIYDAQGRTIAVLTQNKMPTQGRQQVEWKPRSALPSGIYFYSITAEGTVIGAGKIRYQ
jgi:hypothetical protein